MKRLVILFLSFLTWAIFSKVQGNGFIEHQFFPLSPLTEIWPGYLSRIALGIGLISMAEVIRELEKTFTWQVRVLIFLMCGRLIDYLIESNTGWFSISVFGYAYPVSYDTVAFVIFGYTLIKTAFYERRDNF